LKLSYSGSDISTLVKDAVYEPLRISQKAKKFRRVKNHKGEDAWLPVPPS
jgi:SH3-like domain-containing protein